MPPRPPRDRPLPFQPSRGLGLRFLPRVFLDPFPSIGFLASQRLHSVLLAKLWLLQLGQVQSPGFIFESLKPPELLDRWPREFLPPPYLSVSALHNQFDCRLFCLHNCGFCISGSASPLASYSSLCLLRTYVPDPSVRFLVYRLSDYLSPV